jgi:hypothetical protein
MTLLQAKARAASSAAFGKARVASSSSSSSGSVRSGSTADSLERFAVPRRAAVSPKRKVAGGGGKSGGLPEVLRLAMEEQERALEGLRMDLKVLTQIESAWSLDEAEAARQGISAQDMAIITAFDDEDVQQVRVVRAKVESLLATLESEFGSHMRSYQQTIAEMEGILQTRVNVINQLDSSTGIFSRYPDLARFIATKQQKLEEALSGTHQALMDGFATSLARVKLTHGELSELLTAASK